MDRHTFDPTYFREVMGQYPTGVCVVTSIEGDGSPVGMSVGTFTSVSLDPPLVAFLPDQRSSSWAKIRRAKKFSVNVLGAEQEDLCRIFASRSADKFHGLRWHPAPSGAPILDGAVAWIDCVLDVAHEAGDHHIVIGRVTNLGVQARSLPLLFYQGGYGQFMPLSSTAVDSDILDRLGTVDLVRPAMEAVAEDLHVDCMASLRVGEECVYVARAGRRGDVRSSTHVGRRVPLRPPVGGPLMAWADRSEQDAWIARAGSQSGWTPELGHLVLERIRVRGYFLGLGRETYQDLWASLLSAGSRAPSGELNDKLDMLQADWGQHTLKPEAQYEVGILTAPVFGADGLPVLQLNLLGLPPEMTGREIEHAARQLLAAAKVASAAASGLEPTDVTPAAAADQRGEREAAQV